MQVVSEMLPTTRKWTACGMIGTKRMYEVYAVVSELVSCQCQMLVPLVHISSTGVAGM